jgi:hypothetical protein
MMKGETLWRGFAPLFVRFWVRVHKNLIIRMRGWFLSREMGAIGLKF